MTNTDLGLIIFIVLLMVPCILIVRSLMKDQTDTSSVATDTSRSTTDYMSVDFSSTDVFNLNKQSMFNMQNRDKFTGM